MALANRSAVLVHLKEFGTAITDIQLSFQYGYPSNQRYKLYERLAYCHAQLGDVTKSKVAYKIALDCLESSNLDTIKKEEWKVKVNASVEKLKPAKVDRKEQPAPKKPSLLGGPSLQFPSASPSIYVESDDKMGRYFKAKEDIKPGETLVTEKAYAFSLLPDKFGTHCQNCFARLIAPLGCTRCRSVAFCSAQCRDAAESSYHRYECPILDVLIGSGMSILCSAALRIVTQTSLSHFLRLRPSLAETLKGHVGQRQESDGSIVYDPTDYRNIYNLATLSSARTATDFLDRTVMALFLLKCLRETCYFGTSPTDECLNIDENEVFIGSLLLRHLQLLQFNAHEIHEFLQVGDFTMRGTKTAYIGLGIYPTVALFNHSCHPAVGRYFIGTSLVICSSRTIKRNEMVAENYGPMFTSHSRSDRQSRLKGRYWFQCRCPACENNWPTYDGMAEMETVLTRCLYCLGTVKSIPPLHTYVRCQKCKKQMLMSSIQEKIQEATALYRSAMQAMDQMQIDKAISLLSLFISIMEKLDEGPVRERLLAEEALRLCIGTCGTKYSADHHLTLTVKSNADKPKAETKEEQVRGGM